MPEAALPTVGLLTDLWPSASERHSGRFVHAEVEALGSHYRHVVLVPRLLARGLHRRIWGGEIPGMQRGWLAPPSPHRLLPYPMLRVPKGDEVGARALGAAAALGRAGEHPSLLHAHFLHSVAPAAVALARRRGIPSIVTAHGTDARWLADGGVQGRHRRQMLRACLEADRVIAVAPAVAEALTGAGVPHGRIDVIPMGVDADVFRPRDRRAARGELGLDPDARIVLFVGRLSAEKGIDVLDGALARLDDVECFAAGPGTAPSPRVRALGVLEPEQLAEWLAAADVGCLPSFAEGMPVSVGEALAAGRPVVASDVGGIPEQISPGENGFLVPPGDAEALAAALERALSLSWSPEDVRATSERFWWTVVGERLRAVYDELLA